MKHVTLVALVMGALFLAACGGGGTAQQPAQPPAAGQPPAQAPAAEGQTVAVKMSEFKFELSPADVKAGKVTFEVENVGAVEHSFVIEALGVKSEHIQPGQKVTVQADVGPGTYDALCDIAGHKEAGMQMRLVVK